jgi:hypothetical protein
MTTWQEPVLSPDRYMTINPRTDLHYATDFFPVSRSNLHRFPRMADYDPTVIGTYSSFDPRLIDPRRNQTLLLDRPPFQSDDTRMHDIYNPVLRNVRTGSYPDYADIEGGSIIYYDDSFLDDVLVPYVFVNDATIQGSVFLDPMGSMKPQYIRQPSTNNNRFTSEYSFDQDQMEFREDLISKQMAIMNQRDPNIWNAHSQNMFYTKTFDG